MLKSFYLAGFKSIGEPVEIELSKITLLYGENSSGKSSILQALQYAREVFCNQNLDCLRTELGGDYVDLRGFDNFVHDRDPTKSVTMGFKLQVKTDRPGLVNVHAAAGHVEYCHSALRQHQSVLDSLKSFHSTQSTSDVRLLEYQEPTAVLPWNHSEENYEVFVLYEIGYLPGGRKLGCLSVDISINGIEFVKQVLMPPDDRIRQMVNSETSRSCKWTINLNHPILPDKFFDINAKLDAMHDSRLLADLSNLNQSDAKTKSLRDAMCGLTTDESDDTTRQESVESSQWSECLNDIRKNVIERNELLNPDNITSEYGWKSRLIELSGTPRLTYFVQGGDSLLETPLRSDAWLTVPIWLEDRVVGMHDSPHGTVWTVDTMLDLRYAPFTRQLTESDIKDLNLAGLYGGSMILHSWGLIEGHLRDLQYIGPLRRHYEPPKALFSKDAVRSWADGLGGWDLLARHPEICDTVNRWMTGKDLFNFDCRVETSGMSLTRLDSLLSEVDEGTAEEISRLFAEINSPLHVYLRSEAGQRLTSRDVGVGYSQLMPIVVAAKSPSNYSQGDFVMLEQPELHIHVRLQAVLADLLASSDKQFLVETHSEALLLRLMRRIRETSREIINNGPRLLNDSVSIYHIRKEGSQSVARQLKLDSLGNLTEDWPDELFEISFRERFGE